MRAKFEELQKVNSGSNLGLTGVEIAFKLHRIAIT